MNKFSWTNDDIRQMEREGLTLKKVTSQMDIFRRGVSPIRINRPCTLGDGIDLVLEKDIQFFKMQHDRESRRGRMLKFVPASGAASRMFKEWYGCIEKGCFASQAESISFANNLKKYPFYDLLKIEVLEGGINIEELIRDGKYVDILELIITSNGLNYGQLPKALLEFHKYSDGSRTAIEEHLVEAALYTKDASDICRIHFTVSKESKNDMINYFNKIKKKYEKSFRVKIKAGFSLQSTSTNTIAVDSKNNPFRDGAGKLTFRPGGHGSLLRNLKRVNSDIIYIKNIDNVLPDRLKPMMVLYKRILGGYLILLQKNIFNYLELFSEGRIREDDLSSIINFCREKLHIVFPNDFANFSFYDKCDFIIRKLNRPIRICGMVKNTGEPGGGPFWVDEDDGTQSLQIVEEFQIDRNSQKQKEIWKSSTHFNPVDIVCGTSDFQYKKFNLDHFVNHRAVCISQKSEKGKYLKVLELPGLWNGSMALWNTVFIEVPIETFNPVKTVDDLLRSSHQT